MLDQDGFVLCSAECPPPPHPWNIVKSAKYEDRWFFHNSETNESVWRLPPWKDMTGPPELLHNRWTGHVFTALQPLTQSRKPPRQSTASMNTQELNNSSEELLFQDGAVARSAFRDVKAESEAASISTDGSASASGSIGNSFDSSFSAAYSLTPSTSTFKRELRGSVGSNGSASSVDTPPSAAPLRIVQGLGMGGFAVVMSVENMLTREVLAMKVIAKEAATRQRDRMRIVQELKILRDLPPCLFLSRCHFAFESASSIFFVMDLCGGGDLFYHLERCTRQGVLGLGEDASRLILAETAAGLIHLHTNNIVHRDIKVENIMLDHRGHVKIIDFGLAKVLKREVDSFSPTGSLIYMAPELLHGKVGGRFTDWWAYGVVAHELLTGRSPWSTLSDKTIIRREIQSLDLVFPSTLSPCAADLLSHLLDRDYTQRLGTSHSHQIVNVPFFENIDFSALWRGELPGVPLPQESCVLKQDSDAALTCYRARQPTLNNPALEWTLGVEMVQSHPS